MKSLMGLMDPDPATLTSLIPVPENDGYSAAPCSPDPGLIAEFRLAEEARALFGELQWSIEPWIALRLARTEGDFLRREVERLTRLKQTGRAACIGGLVPDSLDRIRRSMTRRACELRAELAASGVPLDRVRLEFVLAVLLRDGASTPTPVEIRQRTAEVDHYMATPVRGASAEAEELPKGVDPELLEDVRQVETLLSALSSVRPKVEFWEAFSLIVRDCRAAKQTSRRLRAPDAEVVRLREALVELRLEKAPLAQALRRYVANLPIGQYSGELRFLRIPIVKYSLNVFQDLLKSGCTPKGSDRVYEGCEGSAA